MELHSSFKLPYEFDCQLLGLINYKDAATYMGTNEGWPTSFDVMDSQCGVCGSPLGDSKAHPGSRGRSMLYTNLNAFKDIVITVRECTNSLCKAMHRVIPTEYGLFNICDKVLVSFDILLEWRELFKRGCPVSNFIAAKTEQLILKIREDLRPSSGQLSYINALLYNGFWAFEMCTERDLSSVVCGVCGTIGEVYFGDGNEKNCCSNSKIVLPKDDQALKQLSSLEQFLDKCRSSLLEKVVYTNCDAVDSIHSEELPPVIAPVLRGASVYNTEHQKRSVYLQKNQATGDPAALHKNIKECNLEMSQLSKYSEDMLRDLASDCHIPVTGKSKAKLCADIYALYSSMLVGLCPCHGYSKVKGHTGGFYHFVCRHGCTVASKFLTLTESVRDAADLFLSLKYPPVVFVCDSPCGFVRHLECRDPELCTQLWGENSGCFEKPEYAKKPTEGIDMPMIVPSEFRRDSVTKKAEDLGQCEHPATGSTRRFVLGDRFHNSKNPHKSALCLFHNIDLCAQKNAIKTSYQESENFRKNLKRLRSATMQGFGLHFCYNFLMDFYQNEEIVKKQKSNLAKHLKEGQEIIRDEYHRLCIVNSTFKC